MKESNLRVGKKLYGYCGGAFGRDHYHECRIEAVGEDWIVVRSEMGAEATAFKDREEMLEYLEDADKSPEDY